MVGMMSVTARACGALRVRVLGDELGHLGDVRLLGRVLGHALLAVPRLPLGLALQVQHAGLVCVVVANGALLEESVQFQELVIAGPLRQGLDFVRGLVEPLV